jgi:hypothetical protein
MNRRRLQALIDRQGSDVSTWPDPERSAALRLLEADREAAAMLRKARALDALVVRSLRSGEDAPAPVARTLRHLMEGLPPQDPQPHRRVTLAPQRSLAWALWPRVAMLVASAALGLALGLELAGSPEPETRLQVSALDEADTDVGFDLFDFDQSSSQP